MEKNKQKTLQDSHVFLFSKCNFDTVALAYNLFQATHFLLVKKSKGFANVSRVCNAQGKNYPAIDCRADMDLTFNFTSSSTLKSRDAFKAHTLQWLLVASLVLQQRSRMGGRHPY